MADSDVLGLMLGGFLIAATSLPAGAIIGGVLSGDEFIISAMKGGEGAGLFCVLWAVLLGWIAAWRLLKSLYEF